MHELPPPIVLVGKSCKAFQEGGCWFFALDSIPAVFLLFIFIRTIMELKRKKPMPKPFRRPSGNLC